MNSSSIQLEYSKFIVRHVGDQMEEQLTSSPAKFDSFLDVLVRSYLEQDIRLVASHLGLTVLEKDDDTHSVMSFYSLQTSHVMMQMASAAIIRLVQEIIALPIQAVLQQAANEAQQTGMVVHFQDAWASYLSAVLEYYHRIAVPNAGAVMLEVSQPGMFGSIGSIEEVQSMIERLQGGGGASTTTTTQQRPSLRLPSYTIEATSRLLDATMNLYTADMLSPNSFLSRIVDSSYKSESTNWHLDMMAKLRMTMEQATTELSPLSFVFVGADLPIDYTDREWNQTVDATLPALWETTLLGGDDDDDDGGDGESLSSTQIEFFLNKLFPKGSSARSAINFQRIRSILERGGLLAESTAQGAIYLYNQHKAFTQEDVLASPERARRFTKAMSRLLHIPMPVNGYAGNYYDNGQLFERIDGRSSTLGHVGAAYFLAQLLGKTGSVTMSQLQEDYRIRQSEFDKMAPQVIKLFIDIQTHPDFGAFSTYFLGPIREEEDGDDETTTAAIALVPEPVERLSEYIRQHPLYRHFVDLIQHVEADERLATNVLEGEAEAEWLRRGLVPVSALGEHHPNSQQTLELLNKVNPVPAKDDAPPAANKIKTQDGPTRPAVRLIGIKEEDEPELARAAFYALGVPRLVPPPGQQLRANNIITFRRNLFNAFKLKMTMTLRQFSEASFTGNAYTTFAFVDITRNALDKLIAPVQQGMDPVKLQTMREDIETILWPFFDTNINPPADGPLLELEKNTFYERFGRLALDLHNGHLPYFIVTQQDPTKTPPRKLYLYMSAKIISIALSFYICLHYDMDFTTGIKQEWHFMRRVAHYLNHLETELAGPAAANANDNTHRTSINRLFYLLKCSISVNADLGHRKYLWTSSSEGREYSLAGLKMGWNKFVLSPATVEGQARLYIYASLLRHFGEIALSGYKLTHYQSTKRPPAAAAAAATKEEEEEEKVTVSAAAPVMENVKPEVRETLPNVESIGEFTYAPEYFKLVESDKTIQYIKTSPVGKTVDTVMGTEIAFKNFKEEYNTFFSVIYHGRTKVANILELLAESKDYKELSLPSSKAELEYHAQVRTYLTSLATIATKIATPPPMPAPTIVPKIVMSTSTAIARLNDKTPWVSNTNPDRYSTWYAPTRFREFVQLREKRVAKLASQLSMISKDVISERAAREMIMQEYSNIQDHLSGLFIDGISLVLHNNATAALEKSPNEIDRNKLPPRVFSFSPSSKTFTVEDLVNGPADEKQSVTSVQMTQYLPPPGILRAHLLDISLPLDAKKRRLFQSVAYAGGQAFTRSAVNFIPNAMVRTVNSNWLFEMVNYLVSRGLSLLHTSGDANDIGVAIAVFLHMTLLMALYIGAIVIWRKLNLLNRPFVKELAANIEASVFRIKPEEDSSVIMYQSGANSDIVGINSPI